MNAVTTHPRQIAIASWDQSRSQIIAAFAQCEFAVTETLRLLSEVHNGAATIKIKPTLKGRLAQLHELLGCDGSYVRQGRAILEPLQAIQEKIELRNLLCHGCVNLYTNDSGAWIARIKMMAVARGTSLLKEELLTEEGTSDLLKQLMVQSKTLLHRLRQFQNNLASKA
jgi:hypothetical protein